MLLFAVLPAFADIGPPPTCASGTHREYLYGNHCVPDGFHLVPKEGGGFEQVADGGGVTPAPSPEQPPAPSIPEAAPATPSATPTDTPPANNTEVKKCATAPGTMGAGLLLAAGLIVRRRRA